MYTASILQFELTFPLLAQRNISNGHQTCLYVVEFYIHQGTLPISVEEIKNY